MGRLSQRLQPPSAYAAALRAGPGPYDARQTDVGPMQQSMAAPVDPLLEFYDSFANISLGDAGTVMLQDYMDNLAVADDPNASTYDKLDAGARVLLGGFEVPAVALGSALMPPGTFGGRFAKTADHAAQARAADMLASDDVAQGIKAAVGDLPMDEASRMGRADELFPVDAYHGTDQNFMEFDDAMRGGNGELPGGSTARRAHWFTDRPESASTYAPDSPSKMPNLGESLSAAMQAQWAKQGGDLARYEELMGLSRRLADVEEASGGNVLPARLRGNYLEVDANSFSPGPEELNDVFQSGQVNRWLDEAEKGGYDGLKILNLADDVGSTSVPSTHYAVFDPANIRSRFARFDPRNIKSRDLLAGGAIGAGAGLGLAATGNNAEASQ